MDALIALLDRASFWLARFTRLAVVVLATGFIVALICQIVFRYIFNSPLSWSEELATFQFVWATLLAASYGVRAREHLRLTLLADALPQTPRVWLEAFCLCLVAVFGVFLVTNGWRLASLVWSNTSAAIGYPIGYLYLSVPISGALIALHSLSQAATVVAGSANQSRRTNSST
ncbi:TRAP transporter small permease [Phaeobacter gallaeciensis]|uniref:TRAP transporter small permease protein n=1 Tax=Phaeobacter gallaeciensis TaxID=60890 RepID=A0ABD4XE28_9RHOB|nr:TRAP transporter small permease [Phaeobacter gallaeciensis]MDE4146570.1 TRAP transporter small permease [Phaeobacter gallaeciensis]MDE4159288.1 TRAP transporter small permease [Phaeobacter gallaeciensis]MDE4163465.1 TRAP transporter small permease [Phaeobacter gallaeciensis]MDE4167695.1 TRAP transporter small permease [Phaeobacter gallaeciensis]MDE4171885.1 TRAP transporter small permease [Phaeobacter gallaeciensis]